MGETVAYDGYKLYGTLGELQGLLAELRYIDTAMHYLEQEEAGWLQEYLGGIVTPGNEHIQVELGRTYPFTKTYVVRSDWIDTFFDDTRSERIYSRLGELSEEANEWAAEKTDATRELIQPYTWPQSSVYESDCLGPVGEAHALLEEEVGEDFGRLQHTIGDWRGDAADNFASYFYFPFEHTLRSQKQLLTALMGGIASAKAIAESSQHSIMNVVYATKAAVLEQLERAKLTAQLERERSQMQTLIIAGGAAAVFAGIFTAGAATGAAGLWAAAFTAVAGTTQIATAAIPDGGTEDYQIEGSTAAELCDSLVAALDQIKSNDLKQHEVLRDEIDAVLRRVATLRGGSEGDDGRLVPIQPDIVNDVDGDNFYLP